MSDAAAAEAFARTGLAVQPAFLDHDEVAALRSEHEALRRAGAFRPACVGAGAAAAVHPHVRGDLIAWLANSGAGGAQRRFLERMEALRVEINRRTFLGLFDFECHFALYPPGAFYARHVDRFRDGGRRVVSCVVYLNERWQAADGGALRLYRATSAANAQATAATGVAAAAHERGGGQHGGGDACFDVLPHGGTLVVFASAQTEHEVLPAGVERASISGWFRTRA